MFYHHNDRLEKPFTLFIKNSIGQLVEKGIERSDIQAFIDLNSENVISGSNGYL